MKLYMENAIIVTTFKKFIDLQSMKGISIGNEKVSAFPDWLQAPQKMSQIRNEYPLSSYTPCVTNPLKVL